MKLTVKKYILILSSICVLQIVLFLPNVTGDELTNSVKASTSWYDREWQYRRPITVDNTGNVSTLTNYQMKVSVSYDSDMRDNFDDIRFTDSDGTTLIDHWLETYVASTSAVFWVEVPSVDGSSSKDVYMYYANSSVSSTSNGDDTFKFFDDFNDDIWTDRWTNPFAGGNYTESGGILALQSTGDCSLDSISTFTAPFIVESRERRNRGDNYKTQFREVSSDNFVELGVANTGSSYHIGRGGTDFGVEEVFTGSSSNGWREYRGFLYSSTWHVYRGGGLDSWQTNDVITLTSSADGRTYYIYLFTDQDGDSRAMWDWIRVREYSPVEPGSSVGAEEFVGYLVTNVTPSCNVVTTSDWGTDVSSQGQTGIVEVGVIDSSTGQRIAVFDVDFSEDRDWDDMSAGANDSMAFFHYPGEFDAVPGGVGNSYTLYVPRGDGDAVGICPNATSLAQLDENCEGLYYLDENDNNVVVVIEGGVEYWKISGLTDTGGFTATALPDTGKEIIYILIAGMMLLLASSVMGVGLKRKE